MPLKAKMLKNLQSDVFRTYQIEKSRGSSKHPYSKFFTGNRKTLLDETKKQGINLRQELIDFNKKYYSANQMTLAVVAPQSLPMLKKMIEDTFSKVPNRDAPKPELAWQISIHSGMTVSSLPSNMLSKLFQYKNSYIRPSPGQSHRRRQSLDKPHCSTNRRRTCRT
jgi:insulysin